jgi:glycine cleavage system aminomethyltransferase T
MTASVRSASPVRSPLHAQALLAGARFVVRDGWEVAASFGPVAAEIAACRAGAGIADLSHVGKLELEAPPELLAACSLRSDRSVWWCQLADDHALVLAEHVPLADLRERLEDELAGERGIVVEVTTRFAAIAVAGPRAREVLAAGVPGLLLSERGDRFVVVCASDDAEDVWLALSAAGRPFGATHVGVDALERLDAVPAD